jgi:predicted ATPase
VRIVLCFLYASQDKFLPVITCRMIHISLQYGINRWTSFAFAGYGVAMTVMSNFAAATRFGNLALDMMKVVRVNDPRTLTLVHGLLEHIQKPLSNGINTTFQVYDIAFSQGDLRYMGQAAFIHCFVRYVAGVRLQLLAKDVVSFATQLKKYNQVLMWKHVVIIHWSTLNLVERNDEIVESAGTVINGKQLESWL